MSHFSSQKEMFEVIASDNLLLDKLIYDEMNSDVVLVKQIASYIVKSGGKRLRPKILLLMAKAFGYEGEKHIILAAIIEFIHIATLLHDDVVDQSDFRRGQPSANAEFSNSAAVLVGDFLYSRSFQLMTRVGSEEVFSILSDTTNRISEGEVMQLMHIGDSNLSEEKYFDIIERKTSCLFEASCWLSAVISGVNEEQIEQSRKYGYALGMAFQMVDDMLDYVADAETMGKSLGDDLKEGKVTLPLIRLMQQGSEQDRELIRQVIEQPSEAYLVDVVNMIKNNRIIDIIQEEVESYTSQACEACSYMPNNVYTQALKEIVVHAMSRQH